MRKGAFFEDETRKRLFVEVTLTELDQPNIFAVQNLFFKIGVRQFDHIAAAAAAGLRATATFATQTLVGQFFGLLQTGIDKTAGRTLSVKVGWTGFRGAEQFDGWKAWLVGEE